MIHEAEDELKSYDMIMREKQYRVVPLRLKDGDCYASKWAQGGDSEVFPPRGRQQDDNRMVKYTGPEAGTKSAVCVQASGAMDNMSESWHYRLVLDVIRKCIPKGWSVKGLVVCFHMPKMY